MSFPSFVFHSDVYKRQVQSQMELDVREVFFQLLEILQIEYFIQCTRTIEIVKFTVGSVHCLGHVHNLRTQWSLSLIHI